MSFGSAFVDSRSTRSFPVALRAWFFTRGPTGRAVIRSLGGFGILFTCAAFYSMVVDPPEGLLGNFGVCYVRPSGFVNRIIVYF